MTYEFEKRAQKIHGEKYDYSRVVYVNMHTPVEIGCSIHGIFLQLPISHIHARAGCPSCNGGKRSSREKIIADFRAIHGERYNYDLVEYVNKDTKVKIGCSAHGVFEQSPHSHKRGRGCPMCKGGVAITTETFLERAKAAHGDRYDYSRVIYKGSQTPVVIICSDHGEFEQTPNNHIGNNKSGCPQCGILKRADSKTRDNEEMQKRLQSIHPEYDFSRFDYDGYHGKIVLGCPDHGTFEKTYWNALNQKCPRCSEGLQISRGEKEVLAYVCSLYEGEVLENCRTALGGRNDNRTRPELDIYIPEKRLGIEYCGVYWHSEKNGYGRHRHREKMDLFHKNGIRLITLFEDEWIEKRLIVEARLRNLLGRTQSGLNARSCKIEEIGSAEAKPFLEAHHIQGAGRASIRFGLYHQDELVSVMTFGAGSIAKGRRVIEGEYELIRFASSRNVRGAAGRLFKAFRTRYDPICVFSYSDLRWNTGAVYERIGMTHKKRTPPNYWYVRRQQRYHRFSLRKNPQDDPALTEWENRQLQGWDRIWDCGSDHFEWRR